jgi:beta-galactosidase
MISSMVSPVSSSLRRALLLADLPEGVEVSLREGGGRRLILVINTHSEAVTIANPPAAVALLSGSGIGAGPLHLDGYGCVVIRLELN